MDSAASVAAATAVIALALPLTAVVTAVLRRVGTLHPVLPSARLGGIVVLCATLSSLGRSAHGTAAVPPPLARDISPKPLSTPPVPSVAAESPASTGYTVRPGDSLWAIACRFLSADGAEPTDADVDRMWRSIYASNRSAVGDDPDLIYPGTILTIPEEKA